MIKTRLVKLLSHAKRYIVFQVLWQWLSLLCQVLMIYSASVLIEKALFGGLVIQEVWQYAGIVAGAVIVRFFCDRQASYASFKASVDVKRILREKIYDKLLRLGASYRENVATSEVVQMAAEGVEQLETYFGRYLPQLFYSLLAPVTLFVILMFVNWKASLVLLICVPLIPISIVAVQKFAKKLLNKYWGIYTELGDSFLENLQGLTTLKIYKADGQKAVEMDEESQRFRQITMKVLTMQFHQCDGYYCLWRSRCRDDCDIAGIFCRPCQFRRCINDHSAGFGIFYSAAAPRFIFSYCHEWYGSQ